VGVLDHGRLGLVQRAVVVLVRIVRRENAHRQDSAARSPPYCPGAALVAVSTPSGSRGLSSSTCLLRCSSHIDNLFGGIGAGRRGLGRRRRNTAHDQPGTFEGHLLLLLAHDLVWLLKQHRQDRSHAPHVYHVLFQLAITRRRGACTSGRAMRMRRVDWGVYMSV